GDHVSPIPLKDGKWEFRQYTKGGESKVVDEATYKVYADWIGKKADAIIKGPAPLSGDARVTAEKAFADGDIVAPIPPKTKGGAWEFQQISKGGEKKTVNEATYKAYAEWVDTSAKKAHEDRFTAARKDFMDYLVDPVGSRDFEGQKAKLDKIRAEFG